MKMLALFLLVPALSFGQTETNIPVDKQLHYLAGSTISGLTYGVVMNITENKKKAFIYSLITPVVIGFFKEVYDSQKPNGVFDGKDFGATVLGGLTISLIFKL